ncbi:DUF2786 domain-containing protein [Glycomyces salinus]|uniref:DUF2786 domain-containing protein n=1 Tax=Glycomyces salinus TaxID=980294 RepID=UPI0018ECFCAE|nr:DUF2786 domain-containing protein [Glycomyces salinus]
MEHRDHDPKQLEKIRQLLAIAEDPATSPEAAEVHTAKAMALLAKYGIDAALLHHTGASADLVEGRLHTLPAPFAFDKLQLLGGIASALRCQAVNISTRADAGQKRLHIFGFTADLDRTEMLYNSLLLQQTGALVRGPGPRPGESSAAYKRSFYSAFTHTVVDRITAAETQARQKADSTPGNSTDLVLADRHRQVTEKFREHYPHVRRGTRRLSGSGRRDGTAAGQRADIGGQRLGTDHRAICS